VSDQQPRDDIDKLLAEVDRMTGDAPRPGASPVPRARRRAAAAAPEGDSLAAVGRDLAGRGRTAAVAAVVAGAGVFAVFAVLPFLGAFSGAAGAALGTFVAVLLLRRR